MLPDGVLDHPSFENFDKLLPDRRKATAYAQLAVGTVGWLEYLRTLWLRTDCILECHWLATKVLALEVSERGVVRRDRPGHSRQIDASERRFAVSGAGRIAKRLRRGERHGHPAAPGGSS